MLDIDINAGLSSVLERQKRRQPCHVNRISALDDPCLRRLVYMRTAWDKAAPIDDGLAGVFQTGHALEPVIERIVSEVGLNSKPRWRIVGNQMPTNDKLLAMYQISGTIDGLLQVETDGRWQTVAVVDIKTMSPNVYPRLNVYDDLCRYSWTKKYRGQLMLYALAHGLETCTLLLVNKSNLYQMKMLSFPIDMEYLESMLQKAGEINEHIAAGTLPEGICNPKECTSCPWLSYCGPDLTTGNGIQISTDTDLEAILDRMAELEPQAEEYGQLAKDRDDMLIKGRNLACGRWLITWSQTNHKPPQWRKTIVAAPALPPGKEAQ